MAERKFKEHLNILGCILVALGSLGLAIAATGIDLNASCDASLFASQCLYKDAVCAGPSPICTCPEGRYADTASKQCLHRIDLNASCDASVSASQCLYKDAVCAGPSPICACPEGRFADTVNKQCLHGIDLNASCNASVSASQCLYKDAVCTDPSPICACPEGRYADTANKQCLPRIDLNASCDAYAVASQCMYKDAVCAGPSPICACPAGRYADTVNKQCLHSGFMTLPDYESAWTDIASSNVSATSYKEFVHGLGEVPLLVDVQVKAIDGPNKGYIFQATGHQQRDNDYPEEYGGVIYIYSANSVRVSAPIESNGNLGRTIYTGVSPYWAGPNAQDSWSAQVRVRCWRESSLPRPDFNSTGTSIKSTTGLATDSYKKISHGINGTPNLVVSRIQFDLNGTIMYADSVGSAGVIYINDTFSKNGYVVFGYDSSNIQVWMPSDTSGRLVIMGDGFAISGEAKEAQLHLYAWSSQTLPYNTSGTLKLNSTQNGSEKLLDYKPVGNENQVFTRSWIQSATSPSNGYMFPGTGSLSYSTTVNDSPCTYGGMVYAYTNQSVRFWQPSHANGAMVCIASCLGTGINNQAVNAGTAVLYSWELDVNECRNNPCKNGATCENSFRSYACKCAPGFAGNFCENKNNGASCRLSNECGVQGAVCTDGLCSCEATAYLEGSTCLPKKANGQLCTATIQCLSASAACLDTAGTKTCACPDNDHQLLKMLITTFVIDHNAGIISKGNLGVATVRLDVPAQSSHLYNLTMTTSAVNPAQKALSILAVSPVVHGDNIQCSLDDVTEFIATEDAVNKAFFSQAKFYLNVTNMDCINSSSSPHSLLLLYVALMVLNDSSVNVNDNHTFELHVNDLAPKSVVFTVSAPEHYATDLAYSYIVKPVCGQHPVFHPGSVTYFDLEITTDRNKTAGPMTIEAPIPDNLTVPVLTFVNAKVVKKGKNLLCTALGKVPTKLSDWVSDSNESDRAVMNLPLVCNEEVQLNNSVDEDKFTLRIGVRIKDLPAVLDGDMTKVNFSIGLTISDQIWVYTTTANVINTMKTPVSPAFVKGIDLLTSTVSATWPTGFDLEWSPDNRKFYPSKNAWRQQSVSTWNLDVGLIGYWFRLVSKKGGCMPANYTLTSVPLKQHGYHSYGPTDKQDNLFRKLQLVVDDDDSTCLALPAANSADTVPYLWLTLEPKFIGLPNQTSAFNLTLVGTGFGCYGRDGDQVTKVSHPMSGNTNIYEGRRPLCKIIPEPPFGTQYRCVYKCDCHDVSSCNDVNIFMRHSLGQNSNTYNLCTVRANKMNPV